jgi:hypothetical protein
VEAAHAYGTPGQVQYGIDILVRLTDGSFEVRQTKRYKAFRSVGIREAVTLCSGTQVGRAEALVPCFRSPPSSLSNVHPPRCVQIHPPPHPHNSYQRSPVRKG